MTALTNVEIRSLLITFPIWEEGVWENLQKGDYVTAEKNLQALLAEAVAPEEWAVVDWADAFLGMPALRGDLDEKTWNETVRPLISRAILGAATARTLSLAYQSLPNKLIADFHISLISAISGKTDLEKEAWLKKNKPDINEYFKNNPAQLSLSLEKKGLLLETNSKRLDILSPALRQALLSHQSAETIGKIASNNKLSEKETAILSEITGLILLGLNKINEGSKLFQEKSGVVEKIASDTTKTLELELLLPLRSEIDGSFSGTSHVIPIENKGSSFVFSRPAETPKEAPITNQPSSGSSPIIPKTLNQQPESFFKPRPTEPEKNNGEPTVGPIIIHQETKAESIATAPKLGFRTSENKLPGAKDRPEPLRAAELTMSGGPDSHALGREDDTSKQKTESVPVLPLGAKFTIPKVTGTSSEKDASKENSSGFLGKIKNVFSKEDPLKTSVPTPPIPPTTTPPVAQLQNISREMTPPVTINIPIKKDIDIKPITQSPTPEKQEVAPISPLPVVQKEKAEEIILPKPTVVTPPAPPAKIPTINPISIPAEKTKSSILPQSTPATAPKVDLKKVTDISIKEIPSTPEEKKPGFFSKLFKRSESKKITTFATKEISPPASMPTAKTISQPTSTPSPLPPPPPAPVQSAPLPKNISGFSPQPLPTQKVSPLIGFKEKGSVSPNIPPIPQKLEEKNVVKTNDIITTPSKVVNYSEYPVSEKNQN